MLKTGEIVKNALKAGVVVPAFNVPYLPMVEAVVQAVRDEDSFALVQVARLEWEKFQAKSLKAVRDEFVKFDDPKHVRLHLDHVPVIDEDHLKVDYVAIIKEAIDLGYKSVMVDASRLDLKGNIDATLKVAELAHAAGIVCEAELGAVLGHESGPMPPYEEIFASGAGFTRLDEAKRFAAEAGCDWLSVAIGNIHGAISGALKDQKKPEARLNIDHLKKLKEATGLPLVLHGGSGIKQADILLAIQSGIAKINVGTEIRQPYEVAMKETGDVKKAQEACYKRTRWVINEFFHITGSRKIVAE
jgi:fructose-bisphosphate aldolase class II